MTESANVESAQTDAAHTDEAAEGSADSGPSEAPTDKKTAGLIESRDRYRTERDAARLELAAAQERLTGFLTAEAERLAGEYLGVASDLWSGGISLADVLGDDGSVSVDLVRANAGTIIADRGDRFARYARAIDPSQGLGGGGGGPKAPTWSDFLKV